MKKKFYFEQVNYSILRNLNLKKILYLIIIFAAVCSSGLKAQVRLSINGASLIPAGSFQDAVEVGYGGNITVSYLPFNPYVEFSLSSGFYHCGYKKDLPDYNVTYSAIPVLAGVRLNFTDFDFIPYVGIEAGVYFTEYIVEVDDGLLGKSSYTTYDRDPGIAAYAGFRMNLLSNVDMDVNAKYNRINTKYVGRAFLLIQTGFAYRF